MTDGQFLGSSMFFKSEWFNKLLEDCENEAIECRNVKLLKREGRSTVWNVCKMLGCQAEGVPGQACRLFERYLYKLLNPQENLNDPHSQVVVVDSIMQRIILMITCCVQLSAKMSSATTSINATVLRIALLTKGLSYPIKEIVAAEMEIFKMLDFCLPLWTSVDMGESLATELKLPTHIVKSVARIVDLAEYYRDEIQKEVLLIANMSTSEDTSGILTLHLVAGAVSAAVRLASHVPHPHPDPAPDLARWLRLPEAYVVCLRNVILKQMKQVTTPRTIPTILKRKRRTLS